MEIKVFTAFSGYDSQCMALDRLHQHNPDFNYELVGWAEIDKYAIQAHNAVYPQWADRNYGDISKIDWAQVPDFDLFTYSSPCQDFSQAGKQAGGTEGSGTRSSLLWECRRAILAKKPKYLLMENVAALVSQKFIRLFNAWQLELESYGYRNFAKVLNAKDYGVPQNRERIFMVSILDEQARYEFPDPMPLTLRLKDVLEDKVDERYYLKDVPFKMFETPEGDAVHVVGELNPHDRWGKCIRQQNFVIGVDGCSMAITAKHTMHDFKVLVPKVLGKLDYPSGYDNTARVYAADGIAPSIQSTDGGNTQPKILEPLHTDKDGNALCISTRYAKESTKKLLNNDGAYANTVVAVPINTDEEGNARTINCHYQDMNMESVMSKSGTGYGYVRTAIMEKEGNLYRIRKLTERECFRLMDVPEEYIDRIQAAGISRSQQYKMAGNSIVVSCMYHIFRKLWIDTQIKTLTLF